MNTAVKIKKNTSNFPHATDIIKSAESSELFFAVVGHIGSGISEVANSLKSELEVHGYDVAIIKASSSIKEWAHEKGHNIPVNNGRPVIEDTFEYQDLGDLMREETQDFTAVAQGMIRNVRNIRATNTGVEVEDGAPIEPDENKRAYIFDSIRHPAEVHLLRTVYHDSFSLIGVVCQEGIRFNRLIDKFYDHRDKNSPASKERVKELMVRDTDDKINDHGQHVADAFFESDYFVDNTVDSEKDPENWQIPEILGRLIDIMVHTRVVRPSIPETAMHHAMTAQIRSSCLSRQVGSAIVDDRGDIISTGTNEVPKAGGGIYGKSFSIVNEGDMDSRCFQDKQCCSSNIEQNELAGNISSSVSITNENDDVISILKKAGLKDLLEFSRAVHAEMDAITTAARIGRPLRGAKMFVTTFPCHYCARHIVASGINEVQYIEPYPKSKAMSLHDDAITSDEINWVAPGEHDDALKGMPNYQKVLFKPFVGVSPRLYTRAFTKDRPLKDKNTGDFKMGSPAWGNKWHVKRVSYTQLEAELTKEPIDET